MNNILKIKDLSKTYVTKSGCVEALKNVNLDIKDGEIIGIIGNSGCGKSTLMSILAKLDKETSGSIECIKDDYVVGYMMQNDGLFPWLTILDNATLGLKIKKQKTKENVEYVKKLLETYGLKDFMYKYPNSLSGGMKQRVALIRTLAIKPDILLLDEPFSALDYQTRQKVTDDVYEIIKREKKTAIMVTHDLGEAIIMSKRVIMLTKRPATIKDDVKIEFENKDIEIIGKKAVEAFGFNSFLFQLTDHFPWWSL